MAGNSTANAKTKSSANGSRQFTPEEDLQFFDRTMEIAKTEKRLVTVGYKRFPITDKPNQFYEYVFLKLFKKNEETGNYHHEKNINLTMTEFSCLAKSMKKVERMITSVNSATVVEQYEEADTDRDDGGDSDKENIPPGEFSSKRQMKKMKRAGIKRRAKILKEDE